MEGPKPTFPKPPPPDDPKRRERVRKQMRSTVASLILAFAAMWAFQEFVLAPIERGSSEISYSEFKKKLADGQVIEVVIGPNEVAGSLKSSEPDKPAPVPFA